jgi:hypothetical protein
VYLIYPIAHWVGTFLGFATTNAIFLYFGTWKWWALPISWVSSIIVALMFGSLAVYKWPKSIYVNSAEIDGMGYVHSNVSWLIQWTIQVMLMTVAFFVIHLINRK